MITLREAAELAGVGTNICAVLPDAWGEKPGLGTVAKTLHAAGMATGAELVATAELVLKFYEPPALLPAPASTFNLVDSAYQCPHCHYVLTQAMKRDNRCGHCDQALSDEKTACPYCGAMQALYATRHCYMCSRAISSDSATNRRLTYLRVVSGINAESLDTVLADIESNPARLAKLEAATQKLAPAASDRAVASESQLTFVLRYKPNSAYITGATIEALRLVILDSYSLSGLQLAIHAGMGDTLEEIVKVDSLDNTVHNLIRYYDRQQRVHALIKCLREQNPTSAIAKTKFIDEGV